MIELKGNGFLLRPWCESDAESLVRYADNRKVWRNLMDTFPRPYTLDDAREWFRICKEKTGSGDLLLAIEKDGEAIGGIGYNLLNDVHSRSASIGYWLGEPFWGQGIATEATRIVTQYAFDNLDILRIEAGVFAWNPASARVLEKAGYTFEARMKDSVFKDGEITDQLLYVRLRSPGQED